MDTIANLLSNRWVLYGGAALGVLGLVLYMRGASGESADDGGASFLASPLLPIGAGAPIATPSVGAGNASGGLGDLGSLIALENKKADYGREVSLAEIDASLATNLAMTQANYQLGMAQADVMTLASFASIYGDAAKLLSNKYVLGTGASFEYGGKVFSFNAAKTHPNAQANANTLSFVNAYSQIAKGNTNAASTFVASPTGSVSIGGGGTASSVGASAVAPVSSPVVAPVAKSYSGAASERRGGAGVLV